MPRLNTKYTEKEIAEICVSFGHVYTGGYTRADKQFNCTCVCGENWSATLNNMRRGHKCRKCATYENAYRRTTEDVEIELALYNRKLLQPYVNGDIPVVYECSCGAIGKSTLGNIRHGQGCSFCVEMKWRTYFLTQSCEIVIYNSFKDIVYQCFCGKIHTTQARQFKDRRKKCPDSTTLSSYKPMSRENLYLWKKAIVNRDNFECQLCNADFNLQVHHIEAYHARPDLIGETTNGITLCYDCHKELHKLYGWNVGIENLRSVTNE